MKNPLGKLWEVSILIIPQVIRIHLAEWEVVVVPIVCRPRRGVNILRDFDIVANYGINDTVICQGQ